MYTTTSRIITLLGLGELTIVQIAKTINAPVSKVGAVALGYWCGLPEHADVAVTRHDTRAKPGRVVGGSK